MKKFRKMTKVLCLFLCFTLSVWSNAETQTVKAWNQQEVLQAISYKNTEELKQFIEVATTEQLNENIKTAYYGDASFLGLIIHFIEDESKVKVLVKQALEKGAGLEGIKEDNFSPLKKILEGEKIEILRLFLDAGLSVDTMTEMKHSNNSIPLFYYILKNNPEFAEDFLAYKPNIIYPKSKSIEYGYLATYLKKPQKPSAKVVKYLLSKGEKADDPRGMYDTPYKLFLKTATIYDDKVDPEIYKHRLEVFNVLLDTGIDPLIDGDGKECVDPLAIVRGDKATLDRLFEKGLKPSQVGCYFESHFKASVSLADLELFKALLEHGGKLFKEDRHGTTVFFEIVNKNGEFLEWLFQNKKEVFEKLSTEDVDRILITIVKHRRDGKFFDLLNFLLEKTEEKEGILKKLFQIAITNNKLTTAEKLVSMGDGILESSTESQRSFWNKKLKSNMIDWLLEHKIAPFDEKNTLGKVVDIEALSPVQLRKLIELYPKEKSKKPLLDELLIAIVFDANHMDEFLIAEKKLKLLKEYGLEINSVLQDNKVYMPTYINTLIADNRELRILWLLMQGVRVTAENQEHYIESNYMRGLIDRAGVGVDTLNLHPRDEVEKEELKSDFFSGKSESEWYKQNSERFVMKSALSVNEDKSTLSVNEDKSTEDILHLMVKNYMLDSSIVFKDVKKAMVEEGFDPIKSKLMVNIVYTKEGYKLYDAIYHELTFSQKVFNFYDFLLRKTVKYNSKDTDSKHYVFWSLIVLFYLFIIITFIMLIRYFIQERKKPLSKKIVPLTLYKLPFILMFIWAILVVFNGSSMNYIYNQYDGAIDSPYIVASFFIERYWYLVYFIILILEFIVVLKIFQLSFFKKTYQYVTFYATLVFFVLSLILFFLPLLINIILRY